MRRLAALAALMVTLPVLAQDFGQQTSMLIYWQKPLGASTQRQSASSFGLRLDRTRVFNSVVFRQPVAELRFSERGYHSLALRGLVMHQNEPASSEIPPEFNFWMAGAVATGVVILVHENNKKTPAASAPPEARKSSGGL